MARIVKLMTNRGPHDIRESASESMTIRDLIDLLENYPMDSKIVLAHRDYNYGYIRESSFIIEDVETYEEQEERERREEEEEENGIWEMCPHCDHEVVLKDQFRWQICPMCNRPILPCRLCDCDCVECSKCPLEKKEDMVLETEIEIYHDKDSLGLFDCECYDGYAICKNIKTGRYISLIYPKKADIDYDTALKILHYRGLYNVSAEDITYGDIMMNYGEIEKN